MSTRWSHAAPITVSLALGLALLGCGGGESAGASAKPSASSAAPTGRASSAAAPLLKAGDAAPAFDLQGSDGKRHALADHLGKQAVVVAWFPKAFTGG